MNLSGWILKRLGWTVDITVPDYPKALICVAPHTSNWDFILGELAYTSVGRKAGFLMKEAWFRFPLGYFFRAIGGIAVPRQRGTSLTQQVVRKFDESERMVLAVTPEGTRSRTSRWRTGFLHIAMDAQVPLLLGIIDFATKQVIIRDRFEPTGDVDADIRAIKAFYRPYQGKYPEKFSTDEESD